MPRCGLCGKSEKLTKTECCSNWICDDNHKYKIGTYSRVSCWRNHNKYTLCGNHFSQGHSGKWQDCQHCRKHYEAEEYADCGTNEYNFEKLQNPPSFEPLNCKRCGKVIFRTKEWYNVSRHGGLICGKCIPCMGPINYLMME